MNREIIEKLKAALRVTPENLPLRLHLADSLLYIQAYTEAESEFQHVLTIDPQNIDAQFGLATAYFHQNKYSTCIVILEEIHSKDPEHKEALELHIQALVKENNLAEAIEYYKKLLTLDPYYENKELDTLLRIPSHDGLEELEFDLDEMHFLEKPDIRFENVGGMDQVKKEIDFKIIQPMLHPELYKAYGKKTGGGILLYGPPGCGKTYLAKATAGEIDAKFISVGLNDILDMWVGSSEKNLHEIFEVARKNTPCVLFFDEIDALGASRSDMRQSAGRHLINQFLQELDGVENNNEGILILGATNAPWHLDAAFRRPGRFDRIIFVAPPDALGREAILKLKLQDKPTQDIDYKQLASKLPEFSGADINALIDRCIEKKLELSMQTHKIELITTKDLLDASKTLTASTKEWFQSAKNFALYANESGLYDSILQYMNIKK